MAGGQEETDIHEPDHRRTVRRAEDKEEAGSDGSNPRETDGKALDDERGQHVSADDAGQTQAPQAPGETGEVGCGDGSFGGERVDKET